MKKKKKYQNQKIILNQNIHIKYYSSLLVFFFFNGFKMKYYYNYIYMLKFFTYLKKKIVFDYNNSLFLNNILNLNYLNVSFMQNNFSQLLYKYTENKNFYSDNYNMNNFFKFNNKLLFNKWSNNLFLSEFKFLINNDNETNNIQVDIDSIKVIYNNLNYLYYFNNLMLYYLFIGNFINVYKIFVSLTFLLLNNK